jgi:hypothetical protein
MQESRTTLIVCAESVPARKYKITRNPAKGALLLSEVFRPPSGLLATKLFIFVTNTLISFNSTQMK